MGKMLAFHIENRMRIIGSSNWMGSCSRRDRWPVRFVTFCAFCLYMEYIYIWGGVGWGGVGISTS